MTENTLSSHNDEIDLRVLFDILWKARIVIFFATLVPAIVAFAVSFWLLPRTYQATAYVFIGNPIINFAESTQFTISPTLPDIKAVAQLAVTPGLLESVTQDPKVLDASGNDKVSINISAVATDIGKDQLRLQVTDTDPQRAALLVNIWAEKITLSINASYGVSAIAETLDTQVLKAQKDYEQAQVALEDVLSKSRVEALSAQLQSKQSDLRCLLDNSSQIMRVLDDLRTFEQELEGISNEEPLPTHHGLTLIILRQLSLTSLPCQAMPQVQSTNIPTPGVLVPDISIPNSPDFTLQINGLSFDGLTISETLALMEQMRTALQAHVVRLQDQQGDLERETPQLQADLENAQAQLVPLTVERDQSQALYTALLERKQLVTTVMKESSKVASVSVYAVPPRNAVSPRIFVNTALAGVLGLVLSAFLALAIDWWRRS